MNISYEIWFAKLCPYFIHQDLILALFVLNRLTRAKYQNQVFALVSETLYFSIIIFSAIWLFSPNPFTAFSYMLGAALGTAYTYGLGKYVETIGGSAYDEEDVKGSGVGSARFAFLIVLFIFVGKFRTAGLQEIPAIMGFFTYQLSSLSQGLKDASSDDF